MRNAKKQSTNKMPKLGLAENRLGLRLVNWVGKLVESRPPVVVALERTWYSLKVLVAGMPITDAEAKAATQHSRWRSGHE